MKYVDEFRRKDLARKLAAAIADESDAGRQYNLMEFCGGHTHAIFRYGVQDLMPDNVRFVHGPGCPVCVLPIARIDNAIELAVEHRVTLCTYGDVLRVPAGQRMSLMKAKASGADVRMVYSTQDALRIARENPSLEKILQYSKNETEAVEGVRDLVLRELEKRPGAMAVYRGKLHGSVNIDELDPEVDLDVCANEPQELEVDVLVKDSFGFGGINCCSVFRRYAG